MAEQLLERISNNNLNDEDKEQLTNLVKPKLPYHRREETKEKIRIRYRDDEEYRQKTLKQRLDYYYKTTADKEKLKRGRKPTKPRKRREELQTKTRKRNTAREQKTSQNYQEVGHR